MSKAIAFSEPSYIFIRPDEMYDEIGKLYASHNYYKDGEIYFITKMKKAYFNRKYKVKNNSLVELNFIVNEKSYKTDIDIIKFLYEHDYYKSKFNNENEFFINIMHNVYIPSNFLLNFFFISIKKLYSNKLIDEIRYLKYLKYIFSKEIKVNFLSDYKISIYDPISKIIADEKMLEEFKKNSPKEFDRMKKSLDHTFDKDRISEIDFSKISSSNDISLDLSIDQIINYNNIEVGNQEILYIGQTKREPFDRLHEHKILQEYLAKFQRNDKEQIILHIFNFKVWDINKVTSSIKKSLNKKIKIDDKITAIESELINYFIPEKNVHYTKENRKEWEHIKRLKKLNYTEIAFELNMDNEYCRFSTSKIPSSKKHFLRITI